MLGCEIVKQSKSSQRLTPNKNRKTILQHAAAKLYEIYFLFSNKL